MLKCKKERWDDLEKRRRREGSELETDIVLLMEQERDDAIASCTGESEATRQEIAAEWENKIAQTRRVFEMARSAEDRRRNVPDWAIDDISFGIMIDPVIVGIPYSHFSP